jgi:phosphoribosylformylglycinamidine (FGAM) synthase-like amidotransferase family enzyme
LTKKNTRKQDNIIITKITHLQNENINHGPTGLGLCNGCETLSHKNCIFNIMLRRIVIRAELEIKDTNIITKKFERNG